MKKLLSTLLALAAVSSYATQILPGPETPLQTILNQNVVGKTINVNTDQVMADSYWTSESSVSAYMLIEIAGYAGDNTFGIYKRGDRNIKQQVFAGNVSGPSNMVSVPVSWAAFGFYIYNPNANFTWYSDSALNDSGALDHFAFFRGATGATAHGWTFDSNDYIIAVEDLNLGDRDYNDMVVLVQNVRSVPEGASTAALMGLGLGALAFIRRKLRR